MSHIAAIYAAPQPQPHSQVHQPPNTTQPQQESVITTTSESSPSMAAQPANAPQPPHADEERKCWICFGEDEDSEGLSWVRPCQCSLVSHEECLLNWIQENQRGIPFREVRCPQCNMVYHLTQQRSWLLYVMSQVDATVQASVPYLTVLGLTSSVLITSTTYGAYAVLTVCGTEQGEFFLGSSQPWGWRVWFGLPLIPAILIGSRTTIFDTAMPLLPVLFVNFGSVVITWPPSPSLTLSILPWARLLYNDLFTMISSRLISHWELTLPTSRPAPMDMPAAPPAEHNHNAVGGINARFTLQVNGEERKDIGRLVVGALLLPAISSAMGGLLSHFSFVRARLPDTFTRNVLGGCLFIVAKDVWQLVYRYQKLRQRASRHVRNHEDYMKGEHE